MRPYRTVTEHADTKLTHKAAYGATYRITEDGKSREPSKGDCLPQPVLLLQHQQTLAHQQKRSAE